MSPLLGMVEEIVVMLCSGAPFCCCAWATLTLVAKSNPSTMAAQATANNRGLYWSFIVFLLAVSWSRVCRFGEVSGMRVRLEDRLPFVSRTFKSISIGG